MKTKPEMELAIPYPMISLTLTHQPHPILNEIRSNENLTTMRGTYQQIDLLKTIVQQDMTIHSLQGN
jgi:hypothetical protein